jgi:hypothetical protein
MLDIPINLLLQGEKFFDSFDLRACLVTAWRAQRFDLQSKSRLIRF